ncbi:MAG: c-type cytochrome [Sulfitobacter sp.]|nr:c-type cytochrome [Sulfitobacter sp.]
MRYLTTPASLFAGLLALAGCQEVAMPDEDEGALFFAQNCVACHGAGGRGNGPIAADLAATPPDLTLLTRRNGGTFPTAKALAYVYGNPERADLSRNMPEFGGTLADDLVPLEVDGVLTPTPRALAALFEYLDSIQR